MFAFDGDVYPTYSSYIFILHVHPTCSYEYYESTSLGLNAYRDISAYRRALVSSTRNRNLSSQILSDARKLHCRLQLRREKESCGSGRTAVLESC